LDKRGGGRREGEERERDNSHSLGCISDSLLFFISFLCLVD
jgi:hypothetical protein